MLHRSEYLTWRNMINRCTDPKHPKYPDYGGRGITVCQTWLASFDSFLRDMGLRPPGLSLDRIDNDAGYSPDNCRWASLSVQNTNRRRWVRGQKTPAPAPIIPVETVKIDRGLKQKVWQMYKEGSLPHSSIAAKELGITPKQLRRILEEY